MFQNRRTIIIIRRKMANSILIHFQARSSTSNQVITLTTCALIMRPGMRVRLSRILINSNHHFRISRRRQFRGVIMRGRISRVVLFLNASRFLPHRRQRTLTRFRRRLLRITSSHAFRLHFQGITIQHGTSRLHSNQILSRLRAITLRQLNRHPRLDLCYVFILQR